MYDKVSTDLNFVDREKEVEKFWKDNHIFEKSIEDQGKRRPPTSSMTDRPQPTESPISAMC